MKILIIHLLLIFSIDYYIFCQYSKSAIDTVYFFKPGKGQSVGQAPEYFPKNIFGLPDTNATNDIPSQSPEQICSIGLGGEIIVGFKNFILENGVGTDFIIFENAFLNPVTKKIFAEPAKVSVSQDGVNYIDFPFDSLTLVGCAGVTPTNGKKNPFDPSESGGDKFDLNTLGLDKIKYIKITDISEMLLNNPSHPYYDAVISGFDLDAVVGLYLNESINTSYSDNNYDGIEIHTESEFILIKYHSDSNNILYLKLVNINGKVLIDTDFNANYYLDLKHLSNGLYFLITNDLKNLYKNKIIINR